MSDNSLDNSARLIESSAAISTQSTNPGRSSLNSVFTETPSLDIQATIADRISAAAKDYTNKILSYMLFVVVGALIVLVWDLNGLIHQAAGATSVASKVLETEVARLNREVKKLEEQIKQRDCLENRRVIDKAGCYRGN